MERSAAGKLRLYGLLVLCLFPASSVWGQRVAESPPIPPNFTLDLETAARLRPELMAQSVPATGAYENGKIVLDHLVAQIPTSSGKRKWELRIVEDDQFNAYASPDGTIYVETGLARVAGSTSGLWAALLSHEIAHVLRRDWARRYLFQKSLETVGTIVLGGSVPAGVDAHWSDAQSASLEFSRFCRQLEIEADREGLWLMALAGYHPDFVPALHHLLHAQNSSAAHASSSLLAMHPCWEERDRELSRAYLEAGIAFERRWEDWHASPGGNPPTLVFAELPTLKKARNEITGAKEWELLVPMHCENLVGTVEVVLQAQPGSQRGSSSAGISHPQMDSRTVSGAEESQLTGCTSPRTTITFTVADSGVPWTDVYILDAWGQVLARADVPKMPR